MVSVTRFESRSFISDKFVSKFEEFDFSKLIISERSRG